MISKLDIVNFFKTIRTNRINCMEYSDSKLCLKDKKDFSLVTS